MNDGRHLPLKFGYPEKTGLYDPAMEKDSCGVGLVANIKGQPEHIAVEPEALGEISH